MALTTAIAAIGFTGATTAATVQETIFGSAVPTHSADPDTQQVELGVQFKAARVGQVTAVRFYKSTANTGPHTGRLYGPTGTLLATVTFTAETASGWQQATFAAPVTVAAGATYTASYVAPSGRYASETTWNWPSASGDLTGTAGVYRYGGGYPTQVWQASNYYVDVVFSPTNAPSTNVVPAFAKGMVWQEDDIRSANGGNFDMDNTNVVAATTKDAVDMQAAGIKRVRWYVGPEYTAVTIQKAVSIFNAHGIRFAIDINYGRTSDAATEATLTTWLNSLVPLMAGMGEHYWEIGNEVNISSNWETCPGITPSRATGQGDTVAAVSGYVARLREAYTSIKGIDSQAFVVMAGLSYDPTYNAYCEITSPRWIAEFIKPGYEAWKYTDGLTVHPYAGSPSGVVSAMSDMRSQFQVNSNFASKPICITEVGAWANGYALGSQNGYIGSDSETARATFYIQMMDSLKAAGVTTPVFWYTWYDYTQPMGYGVVHYDDYTSRTYLPIHTSVMNYVP